MNSRRALKLAIGMAVLTLASAASATTVTTDALAGGPNPTDTLLDYPLLGGPDSHEIARRLLEEQLRFQHDGLESSHGSHSFRRHGHGTTTGQNGQGACGANNVTISTSDNGHRGNHRSRPLPPSTASCPRPHPASGGDGIGSNVPPGGNGDPIDSSGSDSSGNYWLSDPIVPNDAPVTDVPEPGTLALLALGLGSLWLGKRRSERR